MILGLGYWIVLIWFAVAMIALIIEIETVSLVSIWFVIGAFVSMIFAAILPEQYIWQLAIFVVFSALSLILFRPLIKKRYLDKNKNEDINSMIGEKGTAIEDINENGGRVLIRDTAWSAISKEPIKKDSLVVIKEQENLVLTVEEVKNN